jgi:hypothetical protein
VLKEFEEKKQTLRMCKYLMWNCGLPFEGNLRTQESHIAIVQGFNVCEEENFQVNSLVHFGLPP